MTIELGKPTILISRGAVPQIDRLRQILQTASIDILVAVESTSLAEQAALRQPDLIILGYPQFEKPGFSLCRALQGAEVTRSIPIILLTDADNLEGVRQEGFAAGATDYLVSPLNESEVLARIQAWLTLSRQRQALRLSETRYRRLFDQAKDAIFINTEDDVIVDVNEQACALLGYRREELLRMRVPDLQAPEVRRPAGQVIRFELERYRNRPYETVDLHRDGRRIPVEVTTSPFIESDGSRFTISIVRDISSRKEAEAALRNSEARLNGIIRSAMDAIIVVDEEQNIVLFNPTAEEIFGYAAENVLGQPLSLLLPERFRVNHRVHIHDFSMTGVTSQTMGQNVLFGLRADGSEFPLEASISQAQVNDRHFFTAILRDITQRIELEQQFFQAQKMEAVGLLAGGIAHDINNLLVPIMMYASMGLMHLPPDDQAYQYLQDIRDASDRAKQLSQQLLALSSKQVLALDMININDVVKEVGRLLERVIGEHIALDFDLLPGLPLIQADANQLNQILMNLAVNARDAMPGGGRLHVSTDFISMNEPLAGMPEQVEPGSYVLLSIQDTGLGMDETTKKRLFEPFFTTKEPGQGTGLGMATVFGIIKRHQGYIQFESTLGKGSEFQVYFPAALDSQPAPAPRQAPRAELVLSAGAETILIVEDSTSVRRPLAEALDMLGYTVLEATGGVEALRLAAEYASEINLLLTDIMMPNMNGHELRRQLVKLIPHIKVLYMSGYSGDVIERMTLTRSIDLLPKPFSIQQLTRKVAEILAS